MRRLAIVLALVLVPTAARAETLTLGAGLSADVPAKWTWENDFYGYTMSAPDQTVSIRLFHMDDDTSFDAAWQDLENQIGAPVDGLRIGDHEAKQFAGMDSQAATGTASQPKTGKAIGFVMMVMKTPANQYAAFVVQMVKGKAKKHEGEVSDVIGSLRGVTPDDQDPSWWFPSGAHALENALTSAIDGNDAATVYQLMAAKVELANKTVKKSKIKKAMQKAAKASGLATYLGLATEGDWKPGEQVHYGQEVKLYKGEASWVRLESVKGKWMVTGAGEESPD